MWLSLPLSCRRFCWNLSLELKSQIGIVTVDQDVEMDDTVDFCIEEAI
jgi:hypothetical protein